MRCPDGGALSSIRLAPLEGRRAPLEAEQEAPLEVPKAGTSQVSGWGCANMTFARRFVR